MADVRITQYPQKIVVADDDIFLIADSNDVDVNGFLKYKKVKAKDLPSIVNTAENITYANLMALKAANGLIISTFYRITDSTSGVSPLLVQAVGVNAISYQAFDGANPLNTINYDVTTDTIRWNLNESLAPLTSVGLSMPSAFSVSNSPLTANGTLAVTGAGVVSQYVRGDGTLASFPSSTGGGSSVSYYFNGGTSQGVIGGNTYYEMSKTAVIGVGADFNINANGYIAQFVTDANDPSLLNIPAGNWNFEMWFSASSGGGTPNFYLELYKYDGATLTLISSGSAAPESITGGTAIDLYTTALAVPSTALTITDRLAVRVFVNNSSRTITLHTQNGHLCQAITTFSTGLTALNGLTNQVQYLTTGTSGTDFAISSTTDTHTFNLPTASATNRGALSSANWSTFNAKQNAITLTTTGTSGAATLVGATLNIPNYGTALANYLPLAGGTLTGNLIGTTAQFNKIGIGNAASVTSFIFSNVNPTGATSISAWRGIFSASNDVTSRLNGVNIAVGTQASTTISDITAYNAEGTSFGAGSSATRVTGFSADSTLANALATNVYGFQGSIALGTNRWNLYMIGTAANYLQGNLLIGGTNLPLNRKISIEGNITGGVTSYGIDQFVTISSDVTTSMFGYRSNPTTAASAFTLPDLYHFFANDAGIGAGSAITRQYGFFGNIASGTGKWNLYSGGTAANYMNGQLLLGTTTTSAFQLDVVGTARLNGATTIGTDGVANTQNIWTGTSALRIGRNSTQYIDITQDASSARMLATTAGKSFLIGTAEAQSLVLQTNNTTALTINSTQAATFGSTLSSGAFTSTVATAGTSVIGFFNNTDFTAANKSAIRVRQQTGASTGFSAYLGMDGNTLFLSNDTTATNHLAISTTGAATFSSNLTAGLSSATGAQLTLNALYANGINFINTNVAVDNRNFRIITDQGVYGTFNIQKSTTQGGSTYANLLSFDQNSAATFVGTVTASAGLYNIGVASNTWAASSAEGLSLKGSASNGAISTISTYLDDTAITIGAGVSNKTGITINGQTSGSGSSFLVRTGGATRLTINATGNAIFTEDATINGLTVGEGGGSVATNTAVGASALTANTTGANNTAIGSGANATSTTASANTAVGRTALLFNTASNNTAVGFEAAYTNASGTGITAIGYRALKLSTGNNNTALGNSALASNTTATNNTAVGASALGSNTTGGANTAVGLNALALNTTGGQNTAVGQGALQNNIIGNNTAVGYEAALTNTSAVGITAIGYQSLKASTGNNNTALGFQTLLVNTTGIQNTAVGASALVSNIIGNSNTAVGQGALRNNTADNNTAVGLEAANNNTSGTLNTAIGYQSLKANTTATGNTAIGESALFSTTTGGLNTAIGSAALYTNISGINNTAVGRTALFLNTANGNTAVGFEAAYSNTTSSGNTILGYQAAKANSTGANNSIIGFGQVCTNFSGVSMIGVADTATAANQMRFGSATVNNGAVATETVVSDRTWAVFINGVAYKILLKA